MTRIRLVDIAHARSGDKGDRCDLGLFARDRAGYETLARAVTAGRITEHFAGIASGPVEIYPLPNLLALKIVVNGALDGGAARSLRSDNLGKCMAAALLRMEIDLPPAAAA